MALLFVAAWRRRRRLKSNTQRSHLFLKLRAMALFLGRAGSRMAGVAARSLLSGSHLSKGGAGYQFPSAGIRALPASRLPPKASAFLALAGSPQARAAHTVVVVVVKDTIALAPVYAERLTKLINKEISSLDHEFCQSRTPGSVSEVEATEVITDGKEFETKCAGAIDALRKDFDSALYGVKWQQERIYERLDSRIVGLNFVLEDLRDSRSVRNFVDSFYVWAGQKVFHRKIIQAKRDLMTLIPYGSRYFFYCMFAYCLFTSDVPVTDYGILFIGAQWFAAKELKDKLAKYHKFYLNGGKEDADAKAGGQNVV